MKLRGPGPFLAAAALLLVVADGVVLGSAGWNRRGPAAMLRLTERELALPLGQEQDQTGLQLELRTSDRPPPLFARAAWIREERLPRVEHPWLDRAKLATLGFDTGPDPADPQAAEHYRALLPRRVFLALEYQGEAWARWLGQPAVGVDRKDPAAAAAVAAMNRIARSRLMVVDAAPTPEGLQRLATPGVHLVLPGFVGVERVQDPDRGWVLRPSLRLEVERIHVPSEQRRVLLPLLPKITAEESMRRLRATRDWPAADPPRYHATLAVGRGHEAWLVAVELE